MTTTNKQKIFSENPYDLETIFEALSIASDNDKEILYMDMLIRELRENSGCDLTEINYKILQELRLMTLEKELKYGQQSNG